MSVHRRFLFMTSSPVAASSTGLDRFGGGGDRFVSLPARAAGGFDLKKKYLGRNARVACLHRTTRVDPHVASVARRSTGPSRAVDSRDDRAGEAGSAAARRDADRARRPRRRGGVETVDAPGQSARVLGSASRIRAGAAEGSGVRASSERWRAGRENTHGLPQQPHRPMVKGASRGGVCAERRC